MTDEPTPATTLAIEAVRRFLELRWPFPEGKLIDRDGEGFRWGYVWDRSRGDRGHYLAFVVPGGFLGYELSLGPNNEVLDVQEAPPEKLIKIADDDARTNLFMLLLTSNKRFELAEAEAAE